MSFELDEKAKAFALENPQYKRFLKNKPLLRQMYLKHHKVESVLECVEGCNAKLTLMIVSQNKRKPIKVCDKCNKKNCDCGADDYVEKQGRSYTGVDANYEGEDDKESVILVEITPFDEDVDDLTENEVYEIEGKFSIWPPGDSEKGKKQIRVEKVSKVDLPEPDDTQEILDAKDVAKHLLELGDGEVKIQKWNNLMRDYKPHIPLVMKDMDLIEKDGVITAKKSD